MSAEEKQDPSGERPIVRDDVIHKDDRPDAYKLQEFTPLNTEAIQSFEPTVTSLKAQKEIRRYKLLAILVTIATAGAVVIGFAAFSWSRSEPDAAPVPATPSEPAPAPTQAPEPAPKPAPVAVEPLPAPTTPVAPEPAPPTVKPRVRVPAPPPTPKPVEPSPPPPGKKPVVF